MQLLALNIILHKLLHRFMRHTCTCTTSFQSRPIIMQQVKVYSIDVTSVSFQSWFKTSLSNLINVTKPNVITRQRARFFSLKLIPSQLQYSIHLNGSSEKLRNNLCRGLGTKTSFLWPLYAFWLISMESFVVNPSVKALRKSFSKLARDLVEISVAGFWHVLKTRAAASGFNAMLRLGWLWREGRIGQFYGKNAVVSRYNFIHYNVCLIQFPLHLVLSCAVYVLFIRCHSPCFLLR